MEPSQSGKSFFQLMMKYFISSFCILFLAVFFVSSCILQGASRLGSTGDPDNSNTRPRIEVAQCGEKASCEWICDDILVKGSERFRCYQISWTDVNRITNVYEVIMDKKSEKCYNLNRDDECNKYLRGDKSDLEKSITPSDFDFFLQHAKETLIQALRDTGDRSTNFDVSDNTRISNLLNFSLWIAENEDIAKVMLDQDTSLEIGRALFQSLGQALDVNSNNQSFSTPGDRVSISNNNIQVDDRTLFTIDNRVGKENFIQFLYGFIQDLSSNNQSNGESLMIESDINRNDYAFEWGHTILVDFCEEVTNEDQDAIEVKKCLQAIYCIHQEGADIFRALGAYQDIVGSTNDAFCARLNDSSIDRWWD